MAFSSHAIPSPRDDMNKALSSTQIFKITAAASRAAHGALEQGDTDHLRRARLLLERLLAQDVVVPATESTRLAASGIATLRSTVPVDDPSAIDAVRNLLTAIEAKLDGKTGEDVQRG